MRRRQFLAMPAIAAFAERARRADAQTRNRESFPAPELEETTITRLQDGLRSGELTAQTIAEKYLARIRAIDKSGPGLNAVLEVNPDALNIAGTLDRERRDGHVRGPLHGIPVLIKDNIDTGDRMKTSAGSLALADIPAAHDAFLVERLRAAGAVLLGKTNLSEWANFRSSHAVSGWSGRGGQTRNAYVLNRNPSGSSSGSGAATAANLCAVAVGTETDGSVISPAVMNGLVGIKPTVGLVSRSGIVPISHTQDTAGPMARTVRDAAILLTVLAGGVDPRDPATQVSVGHAADYTQFLEKGGLRGARIGVARKFFGVNTALDRLVEEALAEMKRQGAEIIDPADLPTQDSYHETEMKVLLYEFKADLNAYLAMRGDTARVHSLSDIIAFNEDNRDREMPFFGQEIMLQAEKEGLSTEKVYREALATGRKRTREDGIDAVIRNKKVDAIVAPTSGPAWLTDWVNGDQEVPDCCGPAAMAGYPHITVPLGFVHGLPVGLSFFGTAWSEPTLIKFAYAFEQASNARRPPQYLPEAIFP